MKQAKWILGLFSALSLQGTANAEVLSQLQSKLNHQLREKHISQTVNLGAKGGTTSPGTPPPVVRQAAARVRVIKTVLTQNSSGGYDSVDTDVCTTAMTVNVYDARHADQLDMTPADVDRVQCTSTIAGVATTIHVGGIVGLLNENLFGSNQDFKSSIPIMTYDLPPVAAPGGGTGGGGTSGTTQAAISISGSTDMSAHSLLSQLYAITGLICQSSSTSPIPIPPNPGPTLGDDGGVNCTPINEYFSAIVDVQD